MDNQIICPNCKKPLPLTEALSQQVKEQNQQFVEKLREDARRWKEEQLKKNEEELSRQQDLLQKNLKEKIQKEMELRMRDANNEKEELQKQSRTYQEQLLEMNKMVRQLKVQDEQRQFEMEKKLSESQDKMKDAIQKQVEEANYLKMLEKDKKLNDVIKINEELKRKLEQGSQQTQGEVLELEFENTLRHEFPYDEIKEVPKGIQGADLVQIVKSTQGRVAGTIVWEFKRTKTWERDWVLKLKDDQRKINAEIAVLITQVLPKNIKCFGLHEGIWVGDFQSVLGLGQILRQELIKVAIVKSSVQNQNEKKDILWRYLTSTQYQHKIQAIADVYHSMREDLENEKKLFKKKWAKQEMNIQKVTDSIFEMHGELESIMGKELADIKGTELLPETVTL